MQEKTTRRTNASRTEATRAALIASARSLFVEKGYAETSTPEIVRHAGITRGALYHHFEDKADLFRAVLRAEFEAVAKEVEQSADAAPRSALNALRLGGTGYLRAMQLPGRVRLMLLDGPAVLGRAEVDALDQATSEDALRIGLQEAMRNGEIKELPLGALTAQISAMFDRAALGIAGGDELEHHNSVLNAVFVGLATTSVDED